MVRFLAGAETFLFTATSRLALGHTQSPIEWILGAKRLGLKVITHVNLGSGSEYVELYLCFPFCLHDLVLNETPGTLGCNYVC
jgi:hypothetical protein